MAAGIATALTIGTLAMPAAAAEPTKGRIIVVNGMAASKAELCLGKKEIRSTFNYGAKAVIKKDPGLKVFRLKKKSAGTCKGKTFATRKVNLKAGNDLTLVFSRQDPKAVLFPDYTDWYSDIVLRNGSDLGVVEFHYASSTDGSLWDKTAGLGPTEFEKGDFGTGGGWNDGHYVFWAARVSDARAVGGAFVPTEIPVGYRHESILVGTKPYNARWVRLVVKNL